MVTRRDEALLRIFLGEAARADGRPLYEALVLKARDRGLAGATVLRGPLGYGHDSQLHTAKILRLAGDLPMVIEIVDERAKIEDFLAAMAPLLGEAMATVQPVETIRFGRKPA